MFEQSTTITTPSGISVATFSYHTKTKNVGEGQEEDEKFEIVARGKNNNIMIKNLTRRNIYKKSNNIMIKNLTRRNTYKKSNNIMMKNFGNRTKISKQRIEEFE